MAAASFQQKLIARLILLAVLVGTLWLVRQWQEKQALAPGNSPAKQQDTRAQNGVPGYALEVLQYIRKNGEAPEGFVGGREFQNREKKLPQKSGDGARIRYSEWDVHAKVSGQNRGPERLVTGSDHSAWYTKDHYKSFIKID